MTRTGRARGCADPSWVVEASGNYPLAQLRVYRAAVDGHGKRLAKSDATWTHVMTIQLSGPSYHAWSFRNHRDITTPAFLEMLAGLPEDLRHVTLGVIAAADIITELPMILHVLQAARAEAANRRGI